jgi:hypothetical protein
MSFAPILVLAAVPHLAAVRTQQTPNVDGRLDDAVWRSVVGSEGFTQKFPDEGRSPSDRTTVRVLYDDDALYIAFDCEQSHAPLVARLTRRDRQIEADFVEIDVDTRRDGTSAFQFRVNAAGVLSDAILFNDTDSSADWDENWEAATARTEHGWSAEFRIPLRILRFSALPVQDWGFQARRYISMRQETDEWAFIPRDTAGEVSHYGRLDDLSALEPGHPLELRPFVLGRVRQRDPVDSMLASGTDFAGSAGLDLKWHVTQNLTLDATFNPDFAQVEADQVLLNLTNYEIEFPEKRPFFLEGIDTFSTPIQVLYTRRIGHVPLAPVLPAGEMLVDVPDPAPIYAAAKLVGNVGRRLTLGVLSAVTGREDVQGQPMSGSASTLLADPVSMFNVLRLKRAIGENAHVGFIASAANRFEPDAAYPEMSTGRLCPSGDTVAAGSRCFHDAYVGGIDGRWRSPSGTYAMTGQVIGSMIDQGPSRQFLDGTIVSSGDASAGGEFTFTKEGGKHWVGDLGYEGYGRKLDYNDLGYMYRQNLHHVFLDAYYRTLDPWWRTLETKSGIELYDRENLDGLKLARGYQINTHGKFTNFWSYFVELHYREAHFDDREIGDGTALERDGLIGLELSLHTDPRRRVSFDVSTQTQFIFDGFHFEGDFGITLRLHPQLDLDILPTVTRDVGEPRYFGAGVQPGEYVFGKLDATSVGTTLRATYTFTPRLTLQTYAQLFLASLHYADFSSYQSDPTGRRPAIRISDLQPGATPMCPVGTSCTDTEEGALNVNVVLRWEYRLGSTMFLVYTRSQVPKVALLPNQMSGLDFDAVRRGPASQAFLLKLSYWWG